MVAVSFQIGRGLEAERFEIHLHSSDDGLEIILSQEITAAEIDKFGLDPGTGLLDPPANEIAPMLQPGTALLDGNTGFVGDIIDNPAKGVKDAHVMALSPREDGEGKGEVRTTAADDLAGAFSDRFQEAAQSTFPK
jgi:hypothetical protein